MGKHKPCCLFTMILVIAGGLNWGLVGLGGLLGKDLNLLNMLLGSWPVVENLLYLLIGIAALLMLVVSLKCGKNCKNGSCCK